MNELQVNVTQKPGAVQWNFEELVNALQAQMQQYEAMVYTEDRRRWRCRFPESQ